MTYTPTYTTDANTGKPLAPVAKTNYVGLTIAGKQIPGYQTTYTDGTSKWIAKSDSQLNSGYDYSTFTGKKDASGNWIWTPTTSRSVENLAGAAGVTATQVNQSLYQNKNLTTILNANRVNQLGGIAKTQKLDPKIPGANGKETPNIPPTQAPAAPGAGDATKKNSLAEDEKINAALAGAAARAGYGDIQYPEKLNLTHQDYMKFEMLEYVARGLGGGSGFISSTDNARVKGQRKKLGSVTLPIPAGIGDSNQVNWASDELKPEDAFLSSLASDTIQKGTQGASANLGNAADTVKNKTGEVQGIVEDRVTQAVTGISILQRKFGAVTNNNIELLFQGPGLRTFGFTFKLTPRNERESESVKKIIRFFKQGMTPKRSKGELYLKSPNTFTIGYYHGKNLNPYLNKIKECAMTSFNVNYTPEGNYATFADGSMISYEIKMQFQELEPLFDSDYGNNDYNDIGF